jgi:D-glycero-D-manno-heptose 1,7-bisphosphate phosphatase
MSQVALFLDRDGVINADHGYVVKPEDFDFFDEIFEVVAAANRTGYLTIVVTNQAGIGRGYYSESDFHRLTEWMCQQFSKRGVHIDEVYFCPFHPEHGVGNYRQDSECRKPAPGMLLQAAKEYDIDLKRSVLVGDKPSDIEAGQKAGVGTLLYYGEGNEIEDAIQINRLSQIVSFLVTDNG